MPRELKQTDTNKVVLTDMISGGRIGIFYRMPTTEERVAFAAAAYVKIGNKMEDRGVQARIEAAAGIVTGFEDGAFTVDGKPISSDSDKENYFEKWRELMMETASDILSGVGLVVFQGVSLEDAKEPDATGAEEKPGQETARPFARKSRR